MSKLSDLAFEMESIRNKFANQGQKALKEAFKEYFEKHPIVEKILWTQYTPYFMDGEPCVFGINQFEIRFYEDKLGSVQISDLYEDQDADCVTYGEYYLESSFQEEHKAATADMEKLASSCYEVDTILQTVFGDHCMVIATADGFEVSDYNHD